jgi:hypothetical protein
MTITQTDFVESLKTAARENPLGAGLIAGGALWLLIGNDRLKAAVSSAAAAASSTVDQGTHTLRAAGPKLKTTSAPPTAPEMDHEGHSGMEETFHRARSSASDAASGAAEMISEAADSIKDRFDEGIAYAQENFNKMGNGLPDRQTLEWAQSSFSDILERQPLVLGAIGLAIGAAVAGAFQTSEIENEWAGELSDTVKEDLTTRAEAVVESVREGVDIMKSEISDAGAESVDRLKHTGKDALNAARETTTESKGRPDHVGVKGLS